jgi:hypothetical protein
LDKRLILVLALLTSLGACSMEPGPNDPKLTETEKAKDQEEMYTPEEAERLKPPR